MGERRSDLKAREAALLREVARLLRDRGAPAGTTPAQAVAAGLVTRGELDLLAQQYGVRIGPGGRVVLREAPPS